jgi:hypothetical protein
MNSGLSTQNAPSPRVVLPYYIFSAISLVLVSVMLLIAGSGTLASFIGPQPLSIIHMIVLGWISMVIFGALYQLIPVVMEVKLYNENLAIGAFISLAAGTLMLSGGFWFHYIMPKAISIAGGIFIVISILLFVVNYFLTAQKTKVKSTENNFITTSVVWLLVTVLFGLFILLNNKYLFLSISPFELLKAHAALGLMGWFMMLVMGVASTLLPMFFIVHDLKKKYLYASFYLTNSALLLLVISILAALPGWVIHLSSMLLIAGILLFVRYNFDAYKNRLRKKLDIGMKHSVLSFTLLFLSLLSGVILLIVPETNSVLSLKLVIAFGVNLLLGFFTSLILGQMYKTLPFIIWLAKYQNNVGKFKIPLPGDMHWSKVADFHYYVFVAFVVVTNINIFFPNDLMYYLSAILLLSTSTAYLLNSIKIVMHKKQLKPLK